MGAVTVALLVVISAACTSAPAQPVMVRVVMADDWARTDAVVAAVRSFEATHPNVRVQVEPVQFEFMNAAIRDEVASGSPADVIQFHAFAAGAQGLAEPIDDLWASEELSESEFLPGAVDDVRWGPHLYGVPLDANAMLLLYNRDRMHARGAALDGGYTFPDLRRAARLVSAGDRRAIGIPSSTWATYGWMRANGGEVIEVGDDGQARFTFDRPENVEALGFLSGLIRDDLAFPPIGRLGDRLDAFALFRSRATAMHASGTWDVTGLETQGVSWHLGVAVMPHGFGGGAGTGSSVLGGSSMLIPKGAAHRDLAFSFMTTLIDDASALRLAKEEGRLPVRPRVYDDPYFQTPILQTFLEQMRTARPFRLESFPEQHDIFRDAVLDVLQHGVDAGRALKEAQRRVDAIT